jgi:hypothetical protein
VRLSYVREKGAERCPDELALRDSVSSRLGYDPFDDHATRALRAVVRRSGTGLVAQVELFDESGHPQGERTLDASNADCVELAPAMAIAISLGIDPLAASGLPKRSPPPSPEPSPPVPEPPVRAAVPPAVPPAPAPVAPPPAAAGPPVHLRFAVGGAVAIGISPEAPAFGGTVSAGVRRSWISVDLEGSADTSPTATRSGVGAKSELLMASLVPCVHLGVGLACALGGAGALGATGVVSMPSSQHAFYADFGVRLGVEIPFGGLFFVGIHADGLATLTHVTYSIDGQPFWSTPPIAGALGVSLGFAP